MPQVDPIINSLKVQMEPFQLDGIIVLHDLLEEGSEESKYSKKNKKRDYVARYFEAITVDLYALN